MNRTPSAQQYVERYAPGYAEGAENVRFLAPFSAKKNAIVQFRHRGHDLVLKVYRQSFRYSLQAARNFTSRWGSHALALRSSARRRLEAEIASTRAFAAAGFATFEIVERTAPRALVFRYEYGTSLRALLKRRAGGRELVGRASEELGRRQREAQRRNELHLVHPAPRLQHVWVAPGGRLLQYDFEDRINPALSVDDALALELMDWLHYVRRADPSGEAGLLRAAAESVGEDALDRLVDYVQRRRFGFLSGSFRKHSVVLPALDAVRREMAAG